MLLSMTGFIEKSVSVTVNDAKLNVTISLKSINSRFFEAVIKFPYQLSRLETKVSKMLKKNLHRGRVYATLHIEDEVALKSEIDASLPVIEKYLNAVNTIKKSFSIAGNISLSDLINLPNVFISKERKIDNEAENVILSSIDSLSNGLIELQKVEGESILADFKKRITIVNKEIGKIKTLSKKNIVKHREEFNNQLKKIENKELTDTKQAVLYALLDKIDINEETVLFKSYLNQLKNILEDETIEKGKRISFTLQELNREINTISAKCSDTSIGKDSITIKVELEKLREQAQNII